MAGRFVFAAIAALMLAAAPGAKAAPPAAAATPTTLSAEMDAYLHTAERHAAFSGTVLVARDGQPVFQASYGPANRELGVPNRADTAYLLASVSKQFTAMAILQLREQGKLGLDDPVCRYLKDCPAAWAPITLRQLLGHTSGLPNYSGLPDWDETLAPLDYTRERLVGLFRDLPLEHPPGSKFKYSNSGYFLLGMVVERVSGKAFGRYLEDYIFNPLGMAHSRYDESRALIPNRASGYYSLGTSFINGRRVSPSVELGTSGIWSTAGDLLIWERAVTASRLIPPAATAEMFAKGPGDYGLGWRVTQRHGRLSHEHSGSDNGFSTYIIRFPQERLTVIVLSNSDRASAGGVGVGLAAIALGAPYEPAKPLLSDIMWDVVLASGPEAAFRRYEDLKAADPQAFDFSDETLVQLGYDLYEARRYDDAEQVFRFSLKAFPRSAYSHDGLADIAVARGDTALAISHFEQSLAIDPENDYAVRGLARLRPAASP